MKNIWFISDTHFGHENILKFTTPNGKLIRGDKFSSTEEMNQHMYDCWNETVKLGDRIYHLGDVTWIKDSKFVKTFRKLNGDKRLIVGNHDSIMWFAKEQLFTKISMWHLFHEVGLLASHVPLDVSALKRYDRFGTWINVHGHIHQNCSPTPNHRCVCVEWTNYRPIHIDEIEKLDNYIDIPAKDAIINE